MLKGRFGNSTGRPYIEGRVYFEQFAKAINISFLIDTGANKTVIMPVDSSRLYLAFDLLTRPHVVQGIGGYSREYAEPAKVVFNVPGVCLYVYEIDIYIADPVPSNEKIPSLLGRDILNNWSMRYSPREDRLEFDVLHYDRMFPVGRG